jgi:hypothetical protein
MSHKKKTSVLAELRQRIREIEAKEPVRPQAKPLAFTMLFRGWYTGLGTSDEIASRCIGLPVQRLRQLYNHELPTRNETVLLAELMDWPIDRLAQIVETDRAARALRMEAA